MKNLILIAVLNLAGIQLIHAQEKVLKLGSRFTLGQSEIMGGDFENKQAGLLIGIGGSADYQFNKIFGLMGDAMLIKKGVALKGTSSGPLIGNQAYTDKFHFYQAEFPIMAKLRIGSEKFAFRAFAGPSFAFNLMSLQSRIYENQNYNEDNGYENRTLQSINIMDKSLVGGLGIEIAGTGREMFFADLRSSQSLSPIGKIDDKDVFLRHFNVSLGCVF